MTIVLENFAHFICYRHREFFLQQTNGKLFKECFMSLRSAQVDSCRRRRNMHLVAEIFVLLQTIYNTHLLVTEIEFIYLSLLIRMFCINDFLCSFLVFIVPKGNFINSTMSVIEEKS